MNSYETETVRAARPPAGGEILSSRARSPAGSGGLNIGGGA